MRGEEPLEDVIQIQDQYYILTTSSRVDDRTRVLKHGDTFAVLDRFGDIATVGMGELGLYHEGTRFLSRLGVRMAGQRPLLLSSTVREDNTLLSVDLTNPDIYAGEDLVIPRGIVHIVREVLLRDGVGYERLRLAHYGRSPLELDLTLIFDADFRDIFEVRGTRRERRGEIHPPRFRDGEIVLGYRGLDRVERRTRIAIGPRPQETGVDRFRYARTLEPGGDVTLDLTMSCEIGPERPEPESYAMVRESSAFEIHRARSTECEVATSNDRFDDWLERSTSDLHMMITATPHGPYPYAGVPWFSVPFGRDGIITALETLWINPVIGRGVLAYLAATQADETDPARDAEPGKILHETRQGEMAALGEIPFGRYYGSVDATPLFVVLAGAWFERTGDRVFLEALWPHVERALGWMDGPGDPEGDGMLRYRRMSEHGLVQQGWRDSHDSVFHGDGSDAEPPIALCEVQGYAWAARRAAAGLARALGRTREAGRLRAQAAALRRRFEDAFWCEALGTYAMALDGRDRACQVRSSSPGHCLFSGIADRERARRVAEHLMSPASWSGWGVRTISADQVRYNPMSYHNGSVWPHDNAIVAAGFARYGLKHAAARILAGLFEASGYVDLERLPELFCGFDRRPGEGPTLYPVACAPQAWSAGAPFLVLQACLGLHIDALRGRVTFRRPILPEAVSELTMRRLRVGEASVDILVRRHGHGVSITVLHRDGPVDVVMLA